MFRPLCKTLAIIGWLGAWLAAGPGIADERPLVVATNYPLQYFAERIGGDAVRAELLVPENIDPAFWEPDAAAIGGLQQAGLILLNGAGYEKWLGRVSLPRRKLLDTSADFSNRIIETDAGATHSHGLEGEHSHAGTAFTTWLDPTLAVEQARAVRDALMRLLPEDTDALEHNYTALEQDLMRLDEQLRDIVAADADKPLLASHPVYQYLARRYGLNLESVLWEPETVAAEAEWAAFADRLQAHPARWMLWEGEPSAENRRRLGTLGIQSAVYDPCANRPDTGDLLDVMDANAGQLRRVFGR